MGWDRVGSGVVWQQRPSAVTLQPVDALSDASPALLTTPEAAAHLRLRVRTLETWRRLGKGPPFLKLGTKVRYPIADLEAWLAARVRISTKDPGL